MVAPLLGEVRVAVGGLSGVAAACETVKVWPAMVSVAPRELVLVLAVTDQVTVPGPVQLGGVQVSQPALLAGVQVQPATAVTVSVPLLAAAPGAALVGATE